MSGIDEYILGACFIETKPKSLPWDEKSEDDREEADEYNSKTASSDIYVDKEVSANYDSKDSCDQGIIAKDDSMGGGFRENFVPSFNENSANNNNIPQPASKKRKMNGDVNISEDTTVVSRRALLPICAGNDVYMTEEWHKSTSAIFLPVMNDIYVNLLKYDQMTAGQGSFFTGDDTGNFCQTLMGHVLHFWRYDKTERKLYIAMSYLFTNTRDFLTIQSYLQNV